MSFFKIENLTKTYLKRRGFYKSPERFYAIKNLSLDLRENEIFAIIGESGSGKTTLGRCLIRFVPVDTGKIIYQGVDLLKLKEKDYRRYRPKFQMIFQNSAQALDPRQRIGACLAEPLKKHKKLSGNALWNNVIQLLGKVKLGEELLSRLPHELSGGQQQRVIIARALTTDPTLLIADEPTASLDNKHKQAIIELLKSLHQELGLTIVIISHDLSVVSQIADRFAVMYQGELVEVNDSETVSSQTFKVPVMEL
jgi:peptide/nickel transport system ATP-binding protein